MNILSSLFNPVTGPEKKLEKVYVPILMLQLKMPSRRAKKIFRQLIMQIKADLKSSDSKKLPENYGDILLEQEKINPEIKATLSQKRKEGVTDSDIKNWWNMPVLERTVSMVFENYFKGILYAHLRSEKVDQKKIRKIITVGR